jgi:hypothetical protein
MHIVGARWTPSINMMEVRCQCGITFDHRADRWTVRCPCGRTDHLQKLRDRYVPQNQTLYELRDPKFVISIETAIKGDRNQDHIETAQFQIDVADIPRNYMDDIEKLLGNAQARVTVSADFGIKDYGTGASAMASVSLSCNQDTKTIEQAAKLAGDLARDIAQEQRARAEQELQALIAQRTGGSGPSYR